MHNNLIILAGGASSRMKKESSTKGLSDEDIAQANSRSKSLMGVGPDGRPMMDYLLFNAKKAGYTQIYIVINEQGQLFKEYYGYHQKNNEFHGLSISFVVQYIPEGRIKPFGTADALFQAVEQYPELNDQYYTVCNSDNLYSIDALKALRETKSSNAFISYDRDALQFSAERISRFALVKQDSELHLLDIIEKPSANKVDSYKDSKGKLRVSMNIFKFDGKIIYNYLKNCPVHPERNEKELPTVLLNLINDFPKSSIGIPFSEHVPDLTSKDDINAMKVYLEQLYGQRLNWEDQISK